MAEAPGPGTMRCISVELLSERQQKVLMTTDETLKSTSGRRWREIC
jgi:hypothetical protein